MRRIWDKSEIRLNTVADTEVFFSVLVRYSPPDAPWGVSHRIWRIYRSLDGKRYRIVLFNSRGRIYSTVLGREEFHRIVRESFTRLMRAWEEVSHEPKSGENPVQ